MYIIAAILIFGVLIAVHELGHFLAAKACGVRVNEFSIGMGPAIFHTTKGETEYSLRLLPIGGFCAMEGEDEESDDTTVFCLDETMKPAMFYVEGEKWNGKYVGYSVFMTGNDPYMYLGVDAEGNHSYTDLSKLERWSYTLETHLPPKTFKLKYTNLFGNHRSSLKIGHTGTNYEKHDYIISCDGHLLRYFGTEGGMFYYRNISAKGADGTYPEFLSNVKLENKAIQFTL